jgi:hypothetical protein
MSDFMEEFRQSVGNKVSGKLGSEMDLTSDQAAVAIDAVGPLILGGLKRQMEDHGGEERLGHILDKYGDASMVDDPEDYIGRAAKEAQGDPSLGGLLGDSGQEAAGMLDQKLGLSAGMGAKLIPMLAPLILGMLAKKRAAGGGEGGGGGLGALSGVLDRDGDGSILDDIGGMLFKGGGGALAGAAKSGCLGMLFKGRK